MCTLLHDRIAYKEKGVLSSLKRGKGGRAASRGKGGEGFGVEFDPI